MFNSQLNLIFMPIRDGKHAHYPPRDLLQCRYACVCVCLFIYAIYFIEHIYTGWASYKKYSAPWRPV